MVSRSSRPSHRGAAAKNVSVALPDGVGLPTDALMVTIADGDALAVYAVWVTLADVVRSREGDVVPVMREAV